MRDLLTLSGLALASRIRKGELSSEAAVEAHIAQIERVNPTLNAMVKTRFDEARAEAKAADRALAEGRTDLGAFHGVPCSIKESFALQGMPNTSGLVSRRDRPAKEDAPTVAAYRKAGAIPLGVTNTSELCMWMESNNKVYGRSHNPYDPRRTVGGSSGGEGAIVASGGAPFGLGSDIGGSIRMPAFFNGIFGHKPTGGLVTSSGQYPVAVPGIEEYVCTGPLSRRAEDMYPLLKILVGDGPGAANLRDPASVDVGSLSVVVVRDDGRHKVHPELNGSLDRAAAALASKGAKVREARVNDFKYAFAVWGAMIDEAGGPSFAELMGDGTAVPIAREFVRWIRGRSEHTLPALMLGAMEKVPKVVGNSHTKRFIAMGHRLREEVTGLIGEHGVLLFPPHPLPAPLHNRPLLSPFRWVYTGIFNVLKLPVTAAPMGLGSEGVPLGVQIASNPHQDHLTMAVAEELERSIGGWVPPSRWV
ncbi:MAG: amidase [Polyangiaceae bacterium]